MTTSANTGFFDRVFRVVQKIPPGRVTTYGAIAAFVGSPGSARMVGWALNKSGNVEPWLPAHRVLNRNGELTGKHAFHGPDVMQQLLESEGLEVQDNRVMDFQKFFWNPAKELGFNSL